MLKKTKTTTTTKKKKKKKKEKKCGEKTLLRTLFLSDRYVWIKMDFIARRTILTDSRNPSDFDSF